MRQQFQQAAAVPYRETDGRIEILLITTRRKKRWIIPKGLIDDGMTGPEAALMEAWEEAGIRGQITTDSLGHFHYQKWGGICHVSVYAMRVTEELAEWPEMNIRDRRWLPLHKALNTLDSHDLVQIISYTFNHQKS